MSRPRLLRLALPLLAAAALAATLAAYSLHDRSGASPPGKSDEDPARVVQVQGSNLKSITLSERAAARLGIVTQPVRAVPSTDGAQAASAVTLAAVLYDLKGVAWVYEVTRPRTYLRKQVTLDRVQGDLAVYKSGPGPGSQVVTVGAVELYGIETGMGAG